MFIFSCLKIFLLLTFNSVQLDAIMTGVSSKLPENFLVKNWITSLGPRPDDPVINLTAISTLGVTTLFIAVKISSKPWISTAATLSTYFLTLSAILLSMTCSWHTQNWLSVTLPDLLTKLSFCVPTASFSATFAWFLPSIKKSIKNSFNSLRSALSWCFFLRVETIFLITIDLSFSAAKSTVLQQFNLFSKWWRKKSFVSFW